MKPILRLSLLALVAASIAACATAPAQSDLTPPPRKPYDAKTQLESGKR